MSGKRLTAAIAATVVLGVMGLISLYMMLDRMGAAIRSRNIRAGHTVQARGSQTLGGAALDPAFQEMSLTPAGRSQLDQAMRDHARLGSPTGSLPADRATGPPGPGAPGSASASPTKTSSPIPSASPAPPSDALASGPPKSPERPADASPR